MPPIHLKSCTAASNLHGLATVDATTMPDNFLLLRESISAHRTPSLHCAMPPRPTVDDTVDATPLHLHAISRRLRTTSNSTTLSSPRLSPSGRNTTPKCHRRPNRGTEAFACAHGRGGGVGSTPKPPGREPTPRASTLVQPPRRHGVYPGSMPTRQIHQGSIGVDRSCYRSHHEPE